MVHEKDGASYGDSKQNRHKEQDSAEQVAAAHPLRKEKRREKKESVIIALAST